MHYYKEIQNEELISLQSFNYEVEMPNFIEITKNEYDSLIEEIKEKAQQEINDEKIPTYEELEEENARLLYQLLTGEEFE